MNPHSVFELPVSRRRFVLGASGVCAALALPRAPMAAGEEAHPRYEPTSLHGPHFDLAVDYQTVNFTGRARTATTVNGGLPGPTLHWREGDDVVIRVSNRLDGDSSIHWHGMILPSEMDGVPGLSFDGIKPGQTFTYRFKAQQSGTYWYHSHSGFQEQTGLYGAIVIEPKDGEPVPHDRDYVVMLSDWTDEAPDRVYAKLKKESHYYNTQRRTATDFFADVREKGWGETLADRHMWNRMRMNDSDLADVTGYTYTFLMNGNTPDRGWLGLFQPGEKVRLRFINAAAMTIFDVRIPGLKMTVVAADGQNVQPVPVDEFRIGVAETYDVIVEPEADGAYTVFAQSIDRSGYARGTLTTQAGLEAPIPALDPAPRLSHRDMGMGHEDHGATAKSGNQHDSHEHAGTAQATAQRPAEDKHGHGDEHGHDMHHGAGDHRNHEATADGRAGFGSHNEIVHARSEFGPHVDMRAAAPVSGLHDPGIGLREHQQRYGRRVLTYGDLRNLTPTLDKREPSREIQLHLTGNMNRYMWSMDGIKFADAEPLRLTYGERLRIVLVNDTMMTHPIHLHGMWSELETGEPDFIPRKHTIIVQPGSTISYLVTADAEGRWAYHCHLLYHMAGMMREVRVEKPQTEGAHHEHH